MSAEDDESKLVPEQGQKPKRKKLGLLDGEPKKINKKLDSLTPRQQALRDAVINEFKAKKLVNFVTKQIQYINPSRELAEGIRFLFDEHGNPPANAPLEDIIEERKKIEAELKWLEAISKELENKLTKVKEIEALALELIGQDKKEN